MFPYRNRAALLDEGEVVVDCSCRYIDGLWICFAYEVGEFCFPLCERGDAVFVELEGVRRGLEMFFWY